TGSAAPLNPLTGYPGACTGTMSVGLRLVTYQDPEETASASSSLPGATGCSLLDFSPQVVVEAGSETRATNAPHPKPTLPQEANPATPTGSPAKSLDLDFGGGLRLDRGLADAYPTCSAAQATLLVEGPGSCPAESKLGTVRIGTPLVPEMLGGGGGGGGGG